jgi:hypothetical protein
MCRVSAHYKPYVTYEIRKKVMYLQLLKALYGCVKSALLWYELFTGTLQKMRFVLNEYDPCVANMTINDKQCTIAWYVDNTKISHEDPEVVTTIIEKIEERFGKMTVTRGKEHVFLGMNITFNDDGTASVTMKDYLKEAIADFGEDLFDINDNSPALQSKKGEIFHSVVAKLLYVSKRGVWIYNWQPLSYVRDYHGALCKIGRS